MLNIKVITSGILLIGAVSFMATRPSDFQTISQIEQAENTYFSKTGHYFQILKNNKIPESETGKTVSGELGKKVPDHVSVDVYQTKTSQGYQIRWEDTQNTYSKGYGPEAEARTWSQRKAPVSVATTT